MDKSKFNRFPQDSSQQEQFVDEAIDAINAALNPYKPDTSQWDTTPTENSTKPVTSGGIKAYVDASSGKLTPKYTIADTNHFEDDLKALIGHIENGDIVRLETYGHVLFVALECSALAYTLSVICSNSDVKMSEDVYIGYINVDQSRVRNYISSFAVYSNKVIDSIVVYNANEHAFMLETPNFGTKLYKHRLYKEAPVYQQMTIITTAHTFAELVNADAKAIVNITNVMAAGPGSAASVTGAVMNFNVGTSSGNPYLAVSVLKTGGESVVIQNVFSMFDATNDTISSL